MPDRVTRQRAADLRILLIEAAARGWGKGMRATDRTPRQQYDDAAAVLDESKMLRDALAAGASSTGVEREADETVVDFVRLLRQLMDGDKAEHQAACVEARHVLMTQLEGEAADGSRVPDERKD